MGAKGRRATPRTASMSMRPTSQVLALGEHLIEAHVTVALMEAASDYRDPLTTYSKTGVGSDAGKRPPVKRLPCHKSHVSDSNRLAQLGAHGLDRLGRAPEPIRQLRDLTRTRTPLPPANAARMTKVGEADRRRRDHAVLGSLRHHGVSGTAMLEALIDGQRDPAPMVELAKRRLRSQTPAPTEA